MTPSEQSGRPDDDLQDEDLAALYRQAAREEPSPRHDAAILAAAAAELAKSRAPRPLPWWRRWRLSLSLAATVVLTASLVLLVQREQAGAPAGRSAATGQTPPHSPQAVESAPPPAAKEAPLPESPRALQRQDQRLDEGRTAESPRLAEPSGQAASRDVLEAPAKAEGRAKAQAPASPAAARQGLNAAREEDRAAAPASAPEKKALSPFPEDAQPARKPERAPAGDSSASTAAPKASTPSSASPVPALPPGAEGRLPVPAAAAPPAAPAPLQAPAESTLEKRQGVAAPSSRDAVAPSPQDELAEIRALLRTGRTEEARTSLAAFLRRHPGFALPPDLEALRPTGQ